MVVTWWILAILSSEYSHALLYVGRSTLLLIVRVAATISASVTLMWGTFSISSPRRIIMTTASPMHLRTEISMGAL